MLAQPLGNSRAAGRLESVGDCGVVSGASSVEDWAEEVCVGVLGKLVKVWVTTLIVVGFGISESEGVLL